jgi:hypothetical protein
MGSLRPFPAELASGCFIFLNEKGSWRAQSWITFSLELLGWKSILHVSNDLSEVVEVEPDSEGRILFFCLNLRTINA